MHEMTACNSCILAKTACIVGTDKNIHLYFHKTRLYLYNTIPVIPVFLGSKLGACIEGAVFELINDWNNTLVTPDVLNENGLLVG